MKSLDIVKFEVIFLVLLVVTIFTGCTETEEECYSCDVNIDKWAKEHFEEISTYNRKELGNLSRSKRKAAFRTMDALHRRAVWNQKIGLIRDLLKTSEERKHLDKLIGFLEKIDFGKELSSEEVYKFNNWFEYGEIKFGWNKYFLYSSFFDVTTPVMNKYDFEKLYKLELSSNNSNKTPRYSTASFVIRPFALTQEEPDCDTRWCDYCYAFGGQYCVPDCNNSLIGCGWFLLEVCEFDCRLTPPDITTSPD